MVFPLLFFISFFTVYLATQNLTSIEYAELVSRIRYVAVAIPEDAIQSVSATVISYPFPPVHPDSGPSQHTVPSSDTVVRRYFAVLTCPPHKSPFDLGNPMLHLQQILGLKMWYWFLPIGDSPFRWAKKMAFSIFAPIREEEMGSSPRIVKENSEPPTSEKDPVSTSKRQAPEHPQIGLLPPNEKDLEAGQSSRQPLARRPLLTSGQIQIGPVLRQMMVDAGLTVPDVR